MCVCARVLLGSFLLCFAWHESTTTLCLEHWVAWLCFVHAWFHCLLFFIYCKLQQHTKLPCHSIARIQQLCSTTKCCNNRDNGGPLFSLICFIITTKFCIYILYIVVYYNWSTYYNLKMPWNSKYIWIMTKLLSI